MSWEAYGLDLRARKLVKDRSDDTIREAYKMRETVAYGLERFWGESRRYQDKNEQDKASYWEAVWDELVDLIEEDIKLPKHGDVKVDANELWTLSRDNQEVALAVLIQLCDCLVWWTQRYKSQKEKKNA